MTSSWIGNVGRISAWLDENCRFFINIIFLCQSYFSLLIPYVTIQTSVLRWLLHALCCYHKGTFKNYVDHFCPYFDHLPTSTWHFYLIGLLSKVDIWRATYLPPLVNIVIVRPLTWTVLDMMILEVLKTLTGHKVLIWLEKAQLCFIFHFMILSYIFFISEWQVYFDLYLLKFDYGILMQPHYCELNGSDTAKYCIFSYQPLPYSTNTVIDMEFYWRSLQNLLQLNLVIDTIIDCKLAVP